MAVTGQFSVAADREESFSRLVDYVKCNGGALVPKRYKDEDGNPLASPPAGPRRPWPPATLLG